MKVYKFIDAIKSITEERRKKQKAKHEAKMMKQSEANYDQ